MQDEYGRPLSDDGQWVWDGSGWRPTGGPGAASGGAQGPGTVGYEPTMVAPRDYAQTGGQPSQPESPYNAGYQGYPGGVPDPYRPGGPGGPTPFYRKPVVIIGVLLVLSAVLVTVILLTRGGDNSANTTPTASPTALLPTAVPTTDVPTQEPTSAPPTDVAPSEVPTTPPPTSSGPSTIEPGFYDCTSNGSVAGSVTIVGTSYSTNSGATGTYVYDATTGDVNFTGGDLGDYFGTYDPSGPSLDLEPISGAPLHCAQ